MSMLMNGILFGLGLFLVFILVCTAVVLLCRLGMPRTEERGKKTQEESKAAEKPLEALTDDEIRKKILQATLDLDLWIRAGRLRGMEIEASLVNRTDQPEIYLGGRTTFMVKISGEDGRTVMQGPPGDRGKDPKG